MHLAEAVAVLVAGILAAAVADRLVPVAPGRQARVDVVFVGVDQAVRGNGRRDHRLDRLPLHVGEHADHELTTALDQTEDWRLVLLQCAPSHQIPQQGGSASLTVRSGQPLTRSDALSCTYRARTAHILCTVHKLLIMRVLCTD